MLQVQHVRYAFDAWLVLAVPRERAAGLRLGRF
jgi:hypothetical protein